MKKQKTALSGIWLLILFFGCRHCGGGAVDGGMDGPVSLERYGFELMEAGHQAPEFSAVSTDGISYALSDLRGSIVVLHLWGSWTDNAAVELQQLQQLQSELPDVMITVLTVNSSEPENAIRKFCNKNGIELPVLYDIDQAIAARYSSGKLPTTYLIDKKGCAIARCTDTVSWDDADLRQIFRESSFEN